MKTTKLLIISFLLLALSTSVIAQSNKINYQGLLKNSSGNVLANQTGLVGIGIRFGTATSTIVYQENHNVTTDANGVFSIQVGSGTPTTGTYDTLVWGTDLAFVTTSLDGTDLGTTELNAVPFALSSKNDVWSINGTNISNSNTGRVGVGTTSPGAKFMVVGTNGAPTLNVLHDGTTPTNPALRVNDNGRVGIGTTTPGARLMVVGEGSTNATVAFNVVNSTPTSLFHIKDDGNIGVGTTSPTQKLDVVGNVKANSFIALMNTYPDYVFENFFEGTAKLNNTYKFKKLSEIEAFIKNNNHLEGYKSINDLSKDKDGKFIVDISQQSTTNQEKIEELYLHTIELNKKIERLEKLVEQLLLEKK